jgi:prepilin-type N-terminal cleavage/methylation domain-containing protein
MAGHRDGWKGGDWVGGWGCCFTGWKPMLQSSTGWKPMPRSSTGWKPMPRRFTGWKPMPRRFIGWKPMPRNATGWRLRAPRRGVTLVEITVSVMILGILAAVAAPIYSNSLQAYRADNAAKRIVQDILQTQRIARQANSSRSIAFNAAEPSYTLSGINSLDRSSAPYKVMLSQAPYQVTISSLVTVAQPTTQLANVSVTFDRFGMPDQGIKVTVRSGAVQKQVNVAAPSGRVSVQ